MPCRSSRPPTVLQRWPGLRLCLSEQEVGCQPRGGAAQGVAIVKGDAVLVLGGALRRDAAGVLRGAPPTLPGRRAEPCACATVLCPGVGCTASYPLLNSSL